MVPGKSLNLMQPLAKYYVNVTSPLGFSNSLLTLVTQW